MIKRVVVGGVVLVFSACLFGAAFAAPGHSGDGGNNGQHTGMNGGGSNGQGGGDGGQGGHGGNGGNGGGHGSGGDHGGSGGSGGNGSGSGSGGPSGTSGTQGAGTSSAVSGPTGSDTYAGGKDLDTNLYKAVKTCEQERPGLAQGDVTARGWSFRTYDDTVWPYVQRCMKMHGYPAYGVDYSDVSNFGQR